ncbi:hypothetical protein [Streptomyces cinereoruber]|uniref:hypothetical protein n=1 Tax=Streptomyces cinereoruber TaxID=67260 RepID=UPI003624FB07
MATRIFTVDYLSAIGVPPEQPGDVADSDTVLDDRPVTVLKYTAQRECVFRADGRTYAVTYQAPIDTGDYEVDQVVPGRHGWYGDTVEAREAVARFVAVRRWQPAADAPPVTLRGRTLLEDLISMHEDGGLPSETAAVSAGEWLTYHADELAALMRPRLYSEAADLIEERQNDTECKFAKEFGELDWHTKTEGEAARRMARMLRDEIADAL